MSAVTPPPATTGTASGAPAKRSLWRSTLVVSAMTMISRIAGLVRDMVYLHMFGANALMDTFLVAFKIPNFLRRLFAEGAFSQAFVPVLSEYKTQRGDEAVKDLVDKVAGTLGLVLSVVSALAMIASPLVIWLFAPGFHSDPFKFQLASSMLRLTFPYILLISMTAFAGAILNSYGRFGVAAFTPVIMNLVMIASAWWLTPHMSQPVMGLAWGVLAAGILQMLYQVPYLMEIGMMPRFKLGFHDPGVKRILNLMIPAIFGVSVSQINLLLDTILATWLVTGSVSWLYGAERLTELPLGLIGIAVATVILPSLSTKHAENDPKAFSDMLDWALRVVVLVGVPSSLAMMVLAQPLIAALFLHGAFTPNDVAKTASALQALSGGILAFMLIKVFAPGYYSRQDTKTPVRIGMVAMVSNMAFNLMLVWHFKHVGLAAASTMSAFLNAGMLYTGLHKRGVYRIDRRWLPLLLRYAGANVGMVLVLLWITPDASYWLHTHSHWKVPYILGICVAGVAAYFAALFALGFRLREIRHH